jgi:hypothetical protein
MLGFTHQFSHRFKFLHWHSIIGKCTNYCPNLERQNVERCDFQRENFKTLKSQRTMTDEVTIPELRKQIHHLVELVKAHRMVYRKTIFH